MVAFAHTDQWNYYVYPPSPPPIYVTDFCSRFPSRISYHMDVVISHGCSEWSPLRTQTSATITFTPSSPHLFLQLLSIYWIIPCSSWSHFSLRCQFCIWSGAPLNNVRKYMLSESLMYPIQVRSFIHVG